MRSFEPPSGSAISMDASEYYGHNLQQQSQPQQQQQQAPPRCTLPPASSFFDHQSTPTETGSSQPGSQIPQTPASPYGMYSTGPPTGNNSFPPTPYISPPTMQPPPPSLSSPTYAMPYPAGYEPGYTPVPAPPSYPSPSGGPPPTFASPVGPHQQTGPYPSPGGYGPGPPDQGVYQGGYPYAQYAPRVTPTQMSAYDQNQLQPGPSGYGMQPPQQNEWYPVSSTCYPPPQQMYPMSSPTFMHPPQGGFDQHQRQRPYPGMAPEMGYMHPPGQGQPGQGMMAPEQYHMGPGPGHNIYQQPQPQVVARPGPGAYMPPPQYPQIPPGPQQQQQPVYPDQQAYCDYAAMPPPSGPMAMPPPRPPVQQQVRFSPQQLPQPQPMQQEPLPPVPPPTQQQQPPSMKKQDEPPGPKPRKPRAPRGEGKRKRERATKNSNSTATIEHVPVSVSGDHPEGSGGSVPDPPKPKRTRAPRQRKQQVKTDSIPAEGSLGGGVAPSTEHITASVEAVVARQTSFGSLPSVEVSTVDDSSTPTMLPLQQPPPQQQHQQQQQQQQQQVFSQQQLPDQQPQPQPQPQQPPAKKRRCVRSFNELAEPPPTESSEDGTGLTVREHLQQQQYVKRIAEQQQLMLMRIKEDSEKRVQQGLTPTPLPGQVGDPSEGGSGGEPGPSNLAGMEMLPSSGTTHDGEGDAPKVHRDAHPADPRHHETTSPATGAEPNSRKPPTKSNSMDEAVAAKIDKIGGFQGKTVGELAGTIEGVPLPVPVVKKPPPKQRKPRKTKAALAKEAAQAEAEAQKAQIMLAHAAKKDPAKLMAKCVVLQRKLASECIHQSSLTDTVSRLKYQAFMVAEDRKVLAKRLQYHERNRMRRIVVKRRKAAALAQQQQSVEPVGGDSYEPTPTPSNNGFNDADSTPLDENGQPVVVYDGKSSVGEEAAVKEETVAESQPVDQKPVETNILHVNGKPVVVDEDVMQPKAMYVYLEAPPTGGEFDNIPFVNFGQQVNPVSASAPAPVPEVVKPKQKRTRKPKTESGDPIKRRGRPARTTRSEVQQSAQGTVVYGPVMPSTEGQMVILRQTTTGFDDQAQVVPGGPSGYMDVDFVEGQHDSSSQMGSNYDDDLFTAEDAEVAQLIGNSTRVYPDIGNSDGRTHGFGAPFDDEDEERNGNVGRGTRQYREREREREREHERQHHHLPIQPPSTMLDDMGYFNDWNPHEGLDMDILGDATVTSASTNQNGGRSKLYERTSL